MKLTFNIGSVLWVIWLVSLAARTGVLGYTSANAEMCDDAVDKLRILDDEQLASYQKDGFIVMKGVLSDVLTNGMAKAGRAIADRASKFPIYFSVIENGLIFNGGGPFDENQTDPTSVFREVALYSAIPQIAAELMQLDRQTQNLRVLRDIFLAKSVNSSGCDWHVDDHGFWPESYISDASKLSGKDQDGVNVWIALEDMPAVYQGSMALAAGSHRVPWRYEAYEAIGQNRTIDGGHTKEAIVAKLEEKRKSGKVALGACEIGRIRPDLKEKMELTKVTLDIQRGDIVFLTRSLFHKTMDVTEEGMKYYESLGMDVLNRYSIRYTPGTARLPNGWLAEWSAVDDKENPGRSLDQIVRSNGDLNGNFLWYPQVWPSLDEELDRRLNFVADTKLHSVKQKVQEEIVEIFATKSYSQAETDAGTATSVE